MRAELGNPAAESPCLDCVPRVWTAVMSRCVRSQQQGCTVLWCAMLWCAQPACLLVTGVDPSGATWQPWTDQLAYAVLAGLVWGGAKLASAAEEHARVMEAVEAYMAARPIKVWRVCDRVLPQLSVHMHTAHPRALSTIAMTAGRFPASSNRSGGCCPAAGLQQADGWWPR